VTTPEAVIGGSEVVQRALEMKAADASLRERLWAMTPRQRLAAFYRSELSLGDCLAWARRFPDEPPLAPDGEYLFIAVRTPEWTDANPRQRRRAVVGREL
jgi:hypothetical protein